MIDKKAKSVFLAFSMVALLILSSAGSFGISANVVNENNSNQITQLNKKCATVRIKSVLTSRVTSTVSKINSEIHTLDSPNNNDSENILVAGEEGNESYPSMVLSGSNAVVAYEYEDNSDPYIYLRKSNNFGQNWSVPTYLKVMFNGSEISLNSPAICIRPNSKHAYGIFFSSIKNSGIHGIFDIPDITNINIDNIERSIWDLSDLNGKGSIWNMSYPDIVFHDKQDVPWITGYIATTNYTNETGIGAANNTIMFSFPDEDNPDSIWISWDHEIEHCSNLSLNMDDTSEKLFGICEIKNESNQDLLFLSGFHDYEYNEQGEKEYFINLTYQIFDGPENLKHPQIFAKDDQIYIVAETDADGKNEIIVFNSSDEGETWDENIITDDNQPPEADFTYSKERLSVSFFDESFDIDGNITSWYWEFGDGFNSSEKNPKHDYNTAGNYTVTLTVTDNNGLDDSTSKTINVLATTPIADFTYTPINPPTNENISFNSTSTAYPDYYIVNYTWNFGDESDLAYGENVTHQYTNNGSYIVNLTVRDNASATGSIEKIIKVGLVADFTYYPDFPSMGDTIYFNDSSSIPAGSKITDWTWNFGDGSSLVYQQNTTHQYMSPGIYTVYLTIKDEYNTIDSIYKQITVKPGPNSFIPRYPIVFANETHVFCSFTIASNIVITSSLDTGENWDNYTKLNDKIYSVVENYRFADIPDIAHIVWTDKRNEDYDLYSVITIAPKFNLMIVPGSINLTTSRFPFLRTKNRIQFTVKNEGETYVEDITAVVTITRNRTENPTIETGYVGYIKHLEGNGAEKPFEIPLFRITVLEFFFGALFKFWTIDFITVTVDPEGIYDEDSNPADNSATLSNVSYKDIFPSLEFLEDIFSR